MYRKSPYPLHPNQEKWGRADRNAIDLPADASGAEYFTATAATRSQHAATILRGHTRTKTMHLTALDLLRLVGTKHDRTTPYDLSILYGVAQALQLVLNTIKQLLYYKVGVTGCQVNFSLFQHVFLNYGLKEHIQLEGALNNNNQMMPEQSNLKQVC